MTEQNSAPRKNILVENANGFKQFLAEQNVVGMAVGLGVGTAATAMVTSFVNNIILTPIGYFFGSVDGLNGLALQLGVKNGEAVMWNYGQFLGQLVNFLIIAIVFYAVIKIFKLDQVLKKKA